MLCLCLVVDMLSLPSFVISGHQILITLSTNQQYMTITTQACMMITGVLGHSSWLKDVYRAVVESDFSTTVVLPALKQENRIIGQKQSIESNCRQCMNCSCCCTLYASGAYSFVFFTTLYRWNLTVFC